MESRGRPSISPPQARRRNNDDQMVQMNPLEDNAGDRLGAMSQIYFQVQPQMQSRSMPYDWAPSQHYNQPSSHSRSPNTINSICWNSRGTHFVTGSRDSVVRLHAVGNGELKKQGDFKAHTNQINHVDFSNPESENMFSSVAQDCSFRIWDTRRKQPVHVERTKEKLLRGIFCPLIGDTEKGNTFATCNYIDDINFYDTRMWKVKHTIKYKQEINSFMWDKTASALFVADISGTISIYNAVTQQLAAQLTGIHKKMQSVECLAMHPSNEYFVSGGYDSLIAFWDFEDLLCTGTISENNFQVRKLDFSPCGKFLSSICYDESNKMSMLDVYDPERRVSIARSIPSVYPKTCMHWHPEPGSRILAICGEKEDQGIAQLIKLDKNKGQD